MKKLLALLLAVIMVLSLTACGGEGGLSTGGGVGSWGGRYIAIEAENINDAMDRLDQDDLTEFAFVLNDDFTVEYTTDGEEYLNGTWDIEEIFINFYEGENEIAVGDCDIREDCIVFYDFMGCGYRVYFAKEGTDAADPFKRLSEEEQFFIGTWTSHKVLDGAGEETMDFMYGDFVITFNTDYTAEIVYDGETMTDTWTYNEFESCTDDMDFYITVNGDELEIYDGEFSLEYTFVCKKTEGYNG